LGDTGNNAYITTALITDFYIYIENTLQLSRFNVLNSFGLANILWFSLGL